MLLEYVCAGQNQIKGQESWVQPFKPDMVEGLSIWPGARGKEHSAKRRACKVLLYWLKKVKSSNSWIVKSYEMQVVLTGRLVHWSTGEGKAASKTVSLVLFVGFF